MTNYCDTSKLSIRQIDKPTAKKMVVKYHYSKLSNVYDSILFVPLQEHSTLQIATTGYFN